MLPDIGRINKTVRYRGVFYFRNSTKRQRSLSAALYDHFIAMSDLMQTMMLFFIFPVRDIMQQFYQH